MSKFILAIDQGTSGTKALIFNEQGRSVARGSVPLKTIYLAGGFVEQDPEDIYQNVRSAVRDCIKEFTSKGHQSSDIITCGISNQRETFVLWDGTGSPLLNAIVWQCKRSTHICKTWIEHGYDAVIREKTGLLADPYFSASKIVWVSENHEHVRAALNKNSTFFGTVDTWLLYRLSGRQAYKTDHTNASRTMLMNLETLAWDQDILRDLDLTKLQLPIIQPSSSHFGYTDFEGILPAAIPIDAMIGDSHAAAFGEGCFDHGTAKVTLGTGCSILMNVGSRMQPSKTGLVSTICYSMGDHISYAQEGVIVSCGATLEWFKNELGILNSTHEAEQMALTVNDSQGVFVIPAFSGLGAPYWDMHRRAEIKGLSFSSNKNHIVRAALESIPFQINDVLQTMETDTGISLNEIRVNGGITANGFVMQCLANLVTPIVMHADQPDISALGAAYLAGLQRGIWKSVDDIRPYFQHKTVGLGQDKNVKELYQQWKTHMMP
ncbi:FGGY family carbohydrate kinase [Sphingobacterium suaedae]|uniref:ATP:glycerol 3-phosphotransferase n=1 Tax=Sphingobacterium suaedae TaxID=1686402 RepID=A0ABW5KIL1_9SPHI